MTRDQQKELLRQFQQLGNFTTYTFQRRIDAKFPKTAEEKRALRILVNAKSFATKAT